MATLHSALKSLSPTTFSSIPTSPDELDHFLSSIFSDCQVILESVPIADPSDDSHHARSRSTTNASSTSFASNASEMSASSARSPDPPSELKDLQKEWGKPIKLSAKENPLGVSVHKTSGKDGKGAWFARRSVHEGLGFSRFKKGLQREFPESLEVGHGKPGEGNIRGIGGERKVEDIGVKGRGRVQVWQLSAQFPGPTTPRDFITLLITSSRAMHEYGAKYGKEDVPEIEARHYMIISRPCEHPETKPRSGYIRGQYESVEFIREIIRKPAGGATEATSNNVLRHGNHSTEEIPEHGHLHAPGSADPHADDHRKRSTTVGTAQEVIHANDAHHEHYDPEENPIEWIMITRSDPGGSVPRFMVERGTPASIVADASKFLDWACQKDDVAEEPPTPSSEQPPSLTQRPRLDSFSSWQANGTLAGVHETHKRDDSGGNESFPAIDEQSEGNSVKEPDSPTVSMKSEPIPTHTQNEEHLGMLAAASGAFATAIEAYAPKVVLDHLPPGLGTPKANASSPALLTHNENSTLSTSSTLQTHQEHDPKAIDDDAMSDMSSLSFASAESHRTISSHSPDNQSKNESTVSISSPARSKDQTSLTKSNEKSSADPIAKEHQSFTKRRATLDSKLADVRKKYSPAEAGQPLSEAQQEKLRKAEEKHKKQLTQEEEKHKKNLSKLEERREKELKKQEEKEKREKEKQVEKEKQEQEKQRQEKEKDELTKTKRERDEALEKSKVLERQVEMLSKQVGDLQRENTGLKAKMGGDGASGTGIANAATDATGDKTSPGPGSSTGANEARSREILRVIDEEQNQNQKRSRSNSGLRRIRELVASSSSSTP